MTEEEVQHIYDYLHENYTYRSGELICKKNGSGRVVGRALGSFKYSKNNERASIRCQIKLKDKIKYFQIQKLIYLFHHNKYEKYIKFLDGNALNTKIENLIPCVKQEFYVKEYYFKSKKGYFPTSSKNGSYAVSVENKRKKIHIGCYSNENVANEVFMYARDCIIKENLSLKEAKEKTLNKYPSNIRSRSGYKGVQPHGNKFSSFCRGKYIGLYNTPLEAHAAYLKAKEQHA